MNQWRQPLEADLVFELTESRVRGVKPVCVRVIMTLLLADRSLIEPKFGNLGLDGTGISWARTAAEARFIL
jgi:hypothetical protein